MTAPQTIGTNNPNTTNSLESDIVKLAALLSEASAEGNEEADAENIAQLLQRLESATGIAVGVEDKLDGILDHLDELLSSLESSETGKPAADDAARYHFLSFHLLPRLTSS